MEIPSKMKVLIKKEEKASYVLETMSVPEPQADEVLIKVDAVSICGSDIPLYHWNETAKVIASLPFIPGHETAGTVVKCGPKALPTVKVGDKVGIENHFYCEQCYQCSHDRRECCTDMGQYGHGRKTMHGGCSQYSIVSSRYCYVIQSSISAEEIALLEPLGVSHNAIEQLSVEGEEVLVIGCGPIGLLATAVAKNMAASKIIAADIDENRLQLAKAMGADVIVNTAKQDLNTEIMKMTGGNGIGRIAEMSGASTMVNSMFKLLRKGGHIVMVGLPKQPLHVDNVLQDIVFKTLTLKTVHGRRIYSTWGKIEHLVAAKKINLGKVITHRMSMDNYEEAFQILFSGKACKIVLFP